jgi:hypothetical protein
MNTYTVLIETFSRAVPWLWPLVAWLSPRRPGLNPRPVRVGFVVGKVALGQAFLRVLWFSSVSTIPPVLHIHLHLPPTLHNHRHRQRPYVTHLKREITWENHIVEKCGVKMRIELNWLRTGLNCGRHVCSEHRAWLVCFCHHTLRNCNLTIITLASTVPGAYTL